MAEIGSGDDRRRKGPASALTEAVSAASGPRDPGYRIASKREPKTRQWQNGPRRCEFERDLARAGGSRASSSCQWRDWPRRCEFGRRAAALRIRKG